MSANPFGAVKSLIKKQREYLFLRQASNQEIFARIYNTNKWGDSNSRSGKGSSLAQTREIRKKLPHLIKSFKINELLDIPCGDFYWMEETELPIDSYVGADIVPALIEANQSKYARSNRNFVQLDLLTDQLPQTDAILCRECLVHLSFTDIERATASIKKSNSRLLLATNFPEIKTNSDILTGKHRPLNFEQSPFNWPRPITQIEESHTKRHGLKSLALWRITDLPWSLS